MFSKAVKSALQPSVSERTLVMAAVVSGLAVVDVTNGTNVYVGLRTIELLLGHCHPPLGTTSRAVHGTYYLHMLSGDQKRLKLGTGTGFEPVTSRV